MALITIEQQQAIKHLSPNWAAGTLVEGGKTNFEQLAEEVEFSELQSLLGIELFQDLQTNPEEQKYVDLLTGKTFIYNDKNLTLKGLVFMLAYLNFAQFAYQAQFSNTFSGLVKKKRNESEGTNLGEVGKFQTDARKIALQEFEIIKLFLNENPDIYPLWNCTKKRSPYKLKLVGLSKTIN